MKINDILKSFNVALSKLNSDEGNNTFITIVTNINKKLGSIKEIVLNIYLVNKVEKTNQLILKKSYTCNCKSDENSEVIDKQFCDLLSELILLFKTSGEDIANGKYKALENNQD
jgi:hypothetical protein